MSKGLPPAFEPLFSAVGPVLRYRILRDLARRDDSYLDTLSYRQQVEKLPIVRAILAEQRTDGSWGDMHDTEQSVLHLCELGLADHEAVKRCAETYLLTWLSDENNLCHADKALRDKYLRLLVRAGLSNRPHVQQAMMDVITEWSDFLHRAGDSEILIEPGENIPLPTNDAYDAVCFHQWEEEIGERIIEIVTELFAWAERNNRPGKPVEGDLHRNRLFGLLSKDEYLARPEQMLYELELSARLGITHHTTATRWMLEELEIRQDSDGFFRFKEPESSSITWYFPLDEAKLQSGDILDWTFRGLLIFSLLEYNV